MGSWRSVADQKKKHFFGDCTGFYWRAQSVEERTPYLVKDVRLITCGQCKGRILNVIRNHDWAYLKDAEIKVLENAANVISAYSPTEVVR